MKGAKSMIMWSGIDKVRRHSSCCSEEGKERISISKKWAPCPQHCTLWHAYCLSLLSLFRVCAQVPQHIYNVHIIFMIYISHTAVSRKPRGIFQSLLSSLLASSAQINSVSPQVSRVPIHNLKYVHFNIPKPREKYKNLVTTLL
jgi:transposase-like protein